MQKTFIIELDANDLGQVLDGLAVREGAWRDTAIFLRTEQAPKQSFISEECSAEEEAMRIAAQYERISTIIRNQCDAQ